MPEKKQYRNVAKIFEKVRKGELVAENSSYRPKRFSEFFKVKKAELIKPYLHYVDESGLNRSVERFVTQPQTHAEVQALAQKYNKQLPKPEALAEEMSKMWKEFPKEVVNDLFNLFYGDIRTLDFEERTDQNKFRYKMLEKANNPVAKVLTKSSGIKSMVFTRGMVQYFLCMMAMLKQEDPDAYEEMMQQMKGQGEGDGEGDEESDEEGEGKGESKPSDKPSNGKPGKGDSKNKKSLKQQYEELSQRFDNHKAGNAIMDKIIEDAKQTIEDMESIMDKKEVEDLWTDLTKGDKSDVEKATLKTDKGYLSQIEGEMSSVRMNMQGVKDKIKSLLDKSFTYFSSREIIKFEPIFEAETLAALEDYELLHPAIRNIMIDDLMVKTVKKIGKIDIYVDLSGSMESSCGAKDTNGRHITKTMFAKAFAYKMKELDMLNEVYGFESSVHHVGNSTFDILSMSGGGGTCINSVVKAINKNKRNAIVLTDAEDHCSEYADQAFFIGVEGARFGGFDKKVLEKYYDKNQMIVFDGIKTFKVGANGQLL